MQRLTWFGIASLVFTVLLDIIFHDPHHAINWWHRLPGFDALFGFSGCIAIIVGSKWLGKHLLQRHEKYYEKGE